MEIRTLSHYVKMTFLYPRQPFFLFRTLLHIMSRSFSKKMRLRRIFKFLTKIMGYSLWKSGHFPSMLKWHFCSLESVFFFSFRIHLNIMCRSIPKKMRLGRNVLFLTKIKGWPLMKNGHFHTMLDWHFSSLESLFFPFRI